MAQESGLEAVVSASANPEQTRRHLTGWFTTFIDLLDGQRGVRFRSVIQSEPLAHLRGSVADSWLEAALAEGGCDGYCGTMYDAVWAAAIAISR
eukprot:1465362-Rhodomonas_salina.1